MRDIEFGKRLISLRKSAKQNERYTQTEAAEDIHISYKSLQNHEAGKLPNKANLKKYIDFYGCDKVWLLTGEGESPIGVDDQPSISEPRDINYKTIDTSFGTAVDALKEIFDSYDPVLIDAIRSNLYVFRLYARKDHQIKQQDRDIQELKEKYEELKKRFDSLEKRGVGSVQAGSGSHAHYGDATREKES